jgi:hypothetical protein
LTSGYSDWLLPRDPPQNNIRLYDIKIRYKYCKSS